MQKLQIKIRHDGLEDEIVAGPEDAFTFERTFTENGIHQLEIIATNKSNNTDTATYTIKLSLDGLMLDVAFKQADGSDYRGGNWARQSVTASVYASNNRVLPLPLSCTL